MPKRRPRARDQLSATQTDIVTAVGAVEKVDGALSEIATGFADVNALLGNIAADNQVQSASITEISAALGSMDQSTQQNAAMVEETSAAARNLATEVAGLSERAGRFNIGVGRGVVGKTTGRAAGRRASVIDRPVRNLPAAAIPALVRKGAGTADDWQSF